MKLRVSAILLPGLLLASIQVCDAAANMPSSRVQSMLQEVMAIQADPELQGQECRPRRMVAIKKVIVRTFDYDAMARQVLGSYWGKLKKTDQAEFKTVFQSLFEQSYAQMVLDFLRQEKVVYRDEEMNRDRACVKTMIVRVNHEIPVDYTLNRGKGQWLINDIIIDGVSMMGNYHRSFSHIIQQESFKSLLEKLRLQQKANGG